MTGKTTINYNGIAEPVALAIDDGTGVTKSISDTVPMPTKAVSASGADLGAQGTGTAKGGTITVGGTAQTLAAANAARRSLTLQNRSSGDLWINETGGAAIIGDNASYQVTAGGTFAASTNQALSIIGATTGQAFTATETV